MKTKIGTLAKTITVIAVLSSLSLQAIAGNGTQGPCAEIKDSEAKEVCLSVQSNNPDNSISFKKLLKVQGKCVTMMAKSFIDKIYSSDPSYAGRAQIKSQKTVDVDRDYRSLYEESKGYTQIDFDNTQQTLQTYTSIETNEGCRFYIKLYANPERYITPELATIRFFADMFACEVASGKNGLVNRTFEWNSVDRLDFPFFTGIFQDLAEVDAAGTIRTHHYIATKVKIINDDTNSNFNMINSNNKHGAPVATYSTKDYLSCLKTNFSKLSSSIKDKN